jgi:hypothetical protein
MFELEYEPLIISESLKPWKIAVIPWDTETFGFGVSVLDPCGFDVNNEELPSLIKKALEMYVLHKRVKLVTTTIPAAQEKLGFLLQQAGFYFVDQALDIQYDCPAESAFLSPERFSLIPALPQDTDLLTQIAGYSFQHGRYHQDSRIPLILANRRYSDWVRRCFSPSNPQQIMKAVFENDICGFSIVECRGKSGYLHLHAIDSKWQGQKLGKAMIVESIRYLYRLGTQRVGTRISASNIKTMNMHSALRGRFVSSDRLYHWCPVMGCTG